MIAISHTGQLGTANPSFASAVTDLDVAWIAGLPRLLATTRPGAGAGYAMWDLAPATGPAPLVALQSYAAPVGHGGRPTVVTVAQPDGSGSTLVAAGLNPAGWASYTLSAGGFGARLDLPLSFTPATVAAASTAAGPVVYMAPDDGSALTGFRLADDGSLSALAAPAPGPSGAPVDALAVAGPPGAPVLVAASAAGNLLTSFLVQPDGALVAADSVSAAEGIGFSKPSALATVAFGGQDFVIAAGSESSSLTVFRLLSGGQLLECDHVVDGLATRFAGATALTAFAVGGRAYVAAGGSDDGIEVLTLLPDGRLVRLATLSDGAATSLTDVSALAAASLGTRACLFAASASEAGISQFDLGLGTAGQVTWGGAGIIAGGSGDDLLGADAATTEVRGGDGDDIIAGGGPGVAAALFGGAGADIFVLAPSAAPIRIGDFRAGVDRLDLTSFPMLHSVAQLTLTPTATGLLVDAGGTVIVIDSFDGNPIAASAVAQPAAVGLARYAPVMPGTVIAGGALADDLAAPAAGGTLLGRAGDDRLTGDASRDRLEGEDGADTLSGRGGDDLLYGGNGHDGLDGGDGDDSLDGGAGDDTLAGGLGADTLNGGDGADALTGDDGDDILDGGLMSDTLSGGAGRDTLEGLAGDDSLYGGTGDDVLDGGAGNDTLVGDAGNDSQAGGTGNDWIAGLDGADLLWGGTGHDALFGGLLADRLWGEDGNDALWGEDGDDTLDAGAGQDTLWGGTGNDSLTGVDGNDWLIGEFGNDTLSGGTGNDTLGCREGDDRAFGGPGDDVLAGHAGNDLLYGEDGNDFFGGGDGNDSLFGGLGRDALLAEAGNNLIDGGDGDDTLSAYGGNDSLFGGAGNDVLVPGLGLNQLRCGSGNDSVWGDDGTDLILGEAGTDYLFGRAGNDTLAGGAARDQMWGGAGADTFLYASAAEMGHRQTCDILQDFVPGVDKLDFRGLGLRFTGASFGGGAGDLRFTTDATGGNLWLDSNADRVADFSIRLETTFALRPADLLL